MLMGILLYGVPWFLLMLIWEYFLGGTLWHHRTLTVSFFIILGALFGVSMGWFTGATRNDVLLKQLLHRRLLELLSRAFAEIRE